MTAAQSPTHMTPRDLQETNERRFSRKHINGYIEKAILENPESAQKVDQGVQLLTQWLEGTYYPSKDKRLAQLKQLDLRRLVINFFVGIACRDRGLVVEPAGHETGETIQLALVRGRGGLHMQTRSEQNDDESSAIEKHVTFPSGWFPLL